MGARVILCHVNRPQVFCARITFLILLGKLLTFFENTDGWVPIFLR